MRKLHYMAFAFQAFILVLEPNLVHAADPSDAIAAADKNPKGSLRKKEEQFACTAEAAEKMRDRYLSVQKLATRMAELLKDDCSVANPIACAMAQSALEQAKEANRSADEAGSVAAKQSSYSKTVMQDERAKWTEIERKLSDAGVKPSGNKGSVEFKGFSIPYASFTGKDALATATAAGMTKDQFELGQQSLATAKTQAEKEITVVAGFEKCKVPGNTVLAGSSGTTATVAQPSKTVVTTVAERQAAIRAAVPIPRQSLDGLFRLLGDGETPVGIKQSNIFNVISNRYRQLEASGLLKK